jgi:hypothetical protein
MLVNHSLFSTLEQSGRAFSKTGPGDWKETVIWKIIFGK